MLFAIIARDLWGQDDLLKLAQNSILVAHDGIFDKLLRYCAATANDTVTREVCNGGADDTGDIVAGI